MAKMKELNQILDEMIASGQQMIDAAVSIKEYFTADAETKVPTPTDVEAESSAPVEEKKQTLSKEDVRKLLVEKSNQDEGKHKSEVKALVKKYSETGTLGGVNPDDYEALTTELEVIGNA